MQTLAMVFLVPAVLAHGQSTATATAQAAASTVEQTASPELVGTLVKELAITPEQAQGAAGTLFGVAKTKLTPEDFAKVAGAVPNMDGLLKAAPAPGKPSALDMLAKAGGSSSLGAVAGVAETLMKLGIKPETIAKLAPTLIKAVESKGGAEVAALLQGALK
jgi:hypothetical protein